MAAMSTEIKVINQHGLHLPVGESRFGNFIPLAARGIDMIYKQGMF